MLVDILTLFPGMLDGFLRESILGRAVSNGKVDVNLHNLRDWSNDQYNTVDDRPFGGGPGMILKADPIIRAIDSMKTKKSKVVYLCPDGVPLKGPKVKSLAKQNHIIMLSGHYDGIDQRVRDFYVDEEISIGDYVLSNGTLPIAVLLDAVVRYLPGVLGDENSLKHDSFENSLLGFPQYTRPSTYKDMAVPEVLLSGDHAKIGRWRKRKQVEKTLRRRPEILNKF